MRRAIPLLVYLVTLSVSYAASAAVWYVDKDNASGTQDGASWATAFTTVQPAIDAAFDDGGGEVWVAEGVYDEARTSPNADGSGEDTGSVVMKENVHLYGGFGAAETIRNQRDWVTHVTTLDGSTARGGLAAYHVIVGANNATLDGFTITGGNASGAADAQSTGSGGGMYNSGSSPTVANCIFSSNMAIGDGTDTEGYGGGGMYNLNSSPTVINCTFSSNLANFSCGAGMLNRWSSPMVIYCKFFSNSASAGGGGMCNIGSPSPILINCVFYNNSTNRVGGAMYNSESSPMITNCTFSKNSPEAGAGIYNQGSFNSGSSPSLKNCILWGNPLIEVADGFDSVSTITYSIVLGGFPGEGNLDIDPQFVNAVAGDLRLRPGSPAIDAGTQIGGIDDDFWGIPRPQGAGFDMGAYQDIPQELMW